MWSASRLVTWIRVKLKRSHRPADLSFSLTLSFSLLPCQLLYVCESAECVPVFFTEAIAEYSHPDVRVCFRDDDDDDDDPEFTEVN